MDICGYHLRCLSQGSSCSDCKHQRKDKNKDYLYDSLSLWPRGREAVGVIEEVEKSQKKQESANCELVR